MHSFCTCTSTSLEYISQSRAAGFTECLYYILLSIFQVSLQRGFPTDMEWEDLYSHTLTKTRHLKNPFTFFILICETELMFSFIQFYCLMFIGDCTFFPEIAYLCLFFAYLLGSWTFFFFKHWFVSILFKNQSMIDIWKSAQVKIL